MTSPKRPETVEPDEDVIEEGCGYSWDHTVRELGEGHWECTECGAEGWDEDGDEEIRDVDS